LKGFGVILQAADELTVVKVVEYKANYAENIWLGGFFNEAAGCADY
jgi:hypothetical protein